MLAGKPHRELKFRRPLFATRPISAGGSPMMEIGGSTSRVGDWLDSLGLRQYAETFAQNAVTWALLQDLGDQDLRELGVSALGHRKVLLKAITALRSEVPGDPGYDHQRRCTRRAVSVARSP